MGIEPSRELNESASEGSLRDRVRKKAIDLFGEVSGELDELEIEIGEMLDDRQGLLHDVATHLLRAGGKRLRPALVLICARFNSYRPEKLMPIAAAVELIHMATLVHDDVVDESSIRRGLPTVNAKWNEQVSVLLGDYLFAKAFTLLSSSGDNHVVNAMARVVLEMSVGEIQQMSNCFRLDQTEAEYLDRIRKKTATFIAESCGLGAYLSGATGEEVSAVRSYGFGIGMGFQIVDDILDLNSSCRQLGKPVGSDVRAGVITLPVIHALGVPGYRERLRELLLKGTVGDREVGELCSLLQDCGSLEYSRGVAEKYIDAAKKHLAALPDVPSRHTLERIADFVLTRDF